MEELEHICEVQPWSSIPRDMLHADPSSSNEQRFVFSISVTDVIQPYEEYTDDDYNMEPQYGETRAHDFCKTRDEILTPELHNSWQTISNMLSYVHVPLSIQDFMIEKIARCAQEMDQQADKNWKVLCMAVKIWVTQQIGDSNSYMDQEAALDDHQSMESTQFYQITELEHQNQIIVRRLCESASEDCHGIVLYMIKVDNSVVEQFPSCRVCLDEFEIGSKANLTPCKHIYHQDCIINWISTWVRVKTVGCPKPTCPMCRASLIGDHE